MGMAYIVAMAYMVDMIGVSKVKGERSEKKRKCPPKYLVLRDVGNHLFKERWLCRC